MAFFKVKVDGKVYELEKLTLGDARVLKRDFGLTDLEYFSETDPDQMVGLLALAISKKDGVSLADATVQAEALDIEKFSPSSDEPDPTPVAVVVDSGEPVGPATGDPETTPSTPGDPTTPPS